MRVLFLSTAYSYRNNDFIAAAEALGVPYLLFCDTDTTRASPHTAEAVDFADTDAIVSRARDAHAVEPFAAVLALDDSGAFVAVAVAHALGLAHNAAEAITAARDKAVMRAALAASAVPVPWHRRFLMSTPVADVLAVIPFPCVIKPLLLNGSRGVMRADTPAEFHAARQTLATMLADIEGSTVDHPFLVEAFIPGFEVALEAILDAGVLYPLALFDKPDPLDGPLFEETLYVTPSRLPAATQTAIIETTRAAAQAIGLTSGPVHSELRINDDGVWVVEVAGRSIGGLCSRTLRFGVRDSLETLILRQALGQYTPTPPADERASGVMMIPIPRAGILRQVEGVAAACAIPDIEGVEITSPLNQAIQTLPAGESYLGFIFARADTPERVEAALRRAHACLDITITPLVMLT